MVSVIMLLLVTFIGWVVVRYSATYLDGEKRQGRFTALLCATLACVLMVVSAGNLFNSPWRGSPRACSCTNCSSSIPSGSRLSVRRARSSLPPAIGDLSLLVAAGVLAYGYATTDIASILAEARTGEGGAYAIAAAVLIALAADSEVGTVPDARLVDGGHGSADPRFALFCTRA